MRAKRPRIFTLSLTSLAFLIAAASPAAATSGVFVLDGAGGDAGRTHHEIGPNTANAIFDRHVYVFSYDATAGNLRAGWRTDHWQFRRLDGAAGVHGRITADVGSDVAATTFDGLLHVFYVDDTNGNLRHGWTDGTSWWFETLDGAGGGAGRVDGTVGAGPSTAIWDGALHVFYVDGTHTNVRHASFDGASWSFATLDGAGGTDGRIMADVGYQTSAIVFGARLHAFYFFQDPTCDPDFGCRLFGTIREATLAPDGWHIRDVDDINCCFAGQSLATTRSPADGVFLAYQNFGAHSTNLRYRRWTGSAWTTDTDNGVVEDVPFDGEDVGDGLSAITFEGVPYLYFFGAYNYLGSSDGVREAVWTGSGWDVHLIGIGYGFPSSSRVRGSHRLVFSGLAAIPPDSFEGHDLVQARLS